MKFINPINILVLVTFIMGLIFLNKKNRIKFLLFLLLTFCLLIEILSIILLNYHQNITILYSLGFITHNTIWLFMIFSVFKKRYYRKLIILFFVSFSLFNLFFIEKQELNHFTFIFGALLYIFILLFECSKTLLSDNLEIFKSNDFLVLLAPVMFFFGFSFIFGFRNSELRFVKVLFETELYTFISNFVNFLYYFIILDRKSTRLNSSHVSQSRMPSSA